MLPDDQAPAQSLTTVCGRMGGVATDGISPATFRIFSTLYTGCIAFALLNYGGAEIISLATVGVLVLISLIYLVWRDGMPVHVSTATVGGLLVVGAMLAWIALGALQSADQTFAHPAWREVETSDITAFGAISIAPGDDWASFLRLLLPISFFLLGLRIFDTDTRAGAALKFIAVSGGAIAAASIAQFQLAPRALIFGAKLAYLDSLTAPFVNRNTAATFYGIVCIHSLALSCRAFSKFGWRKFFLDKSARRFQPRERERLGSLCLYVIVLFLAFTALMLTKSRAGIGASVVGMGVTLFSFIFFDRRRESASWLLKRESTSRRLLFSFFASIAAAFLLSALAGRTLLRAEILGADDARFCVVRGIVAGIFDHLPFGAGFSGFEAIFPLYREQLCGISLVWDRAHSFYLEGFFATGYVFPTLLVPSIGFLLLTFIRGLRQRQRYRYAAEAGLATSVLVLAHSVIDFSLQVTGFAMFYAATLAPTVSICLSQPHEKSMLRERSR